MNLLRHKKLEMEPPLTGLNKTSSTFSLSQRERAGVRENAHAPSNRFSIFLAALPALLLTGCQAAEHSPTVDVLGSYFPAWIVCIVLGLALTIITRHIFIIVKLHSHLRPVLLVYLCLMICFTLAIWLLFFRN